MHIPRDQGPGAAPQQLYYPGQRRALALFLTEHARTGQDRIPADRREP
jgi:hypothetical protein